MNTNTDTGSKGRAARYVGVAGGEVKEAGASVWWDRGQAVTRGALADAWEAAGLPSALLPPDKSVEAALHDAMDDLRTKRHLVRRAPDARGGWMIIVETSDATEKEALKAWKGQPQAHAWLDRVGRLQVAFPDNAPEAERTKLEHDLRNAYASRRTTLDGGEVTGWIKSLLLSLRAILLREDGGVWFVPHTTLPQWHTMADVITAATRTSLHEMTTVFLGDGADRTVGTILSAIKREAEEAVAKTMNEIAEASAKGKPLGANALASREKRCRDLASKVASYEDLLGTELPEIQERIEGLRAACVTANMVASSERAGAGAQASLAGLV